MRRTDRDTAFTAFVTSARPRLERYARLLHPRDPHAAEDLVQTALTKVYVHWANVTRADNPVAYAHRIMTTTFIDEGRRRRHRAEVTTDSPPEINGGGMPAADHLLGERSAVLAALAALPPRQRAVIVLRHWVDYSVDQTAELLGCTPGTVKSQNAKALEHLRGALRVHEPLTTTGAHDD